VVGQLIVGNSTRQYALGLCRDSFSEKALLIDRLGSVKTKSLPII